MEESQETGISVKPPKKVNEQGAKQLSKYKAKLARMAERRKAKRKSTRELKKEDKVLSRLEDAWLAVWKLSNESGDLSADGRLRIRDLLDVIEVDIVVRSEEVSDVEQ